MVPAGEPVDEMIGKLSPLLDAGRHPHRRRQLVFRGHPPARSGAARAAAEFRRLRRLGRRRGRALRSVDHARWIRRTAWARIKDVLEAIAAKTDAGPCVTHVGPDGAGHFVKMVHNGIEYGDMQIIAEAYDVLHRGLGLSTPEAGGVFEAWNRGPLESFLVELTGAGLPGRRIPRPGSRWWTSSRTRPARRARASGRRRSRSISPSRSRRSARRSTRACCPA